MELSPKQKAAELVEKYKKNRLCILTSVDSIPMVISDYPTFMSSKMLALIAINEIISDLKSYRVKYWLTLEHAIEMAKYWEDVKEEIEKL